jgi:hypothetical protein
MRIAHNWGFWNEGKEKAKVTQTCLELLLHLLYFSILHKRHPNKHSSSSLPKNKYVARALSVDECVLTSRTRSSLIARSLSVSSLFMTAISSDMLLDQHVKLCMHIHRETQTYR